jgi:hypothetical protein
LLSYGNSKIDENMAIHWNPMFMNVCCKFPQEANNRWGPSTVKYVKKVVLKKINFKNNLFSTLTLKKILKTYLNCIMKS